ncbi:MAG: hypothetical protein JWM44_388 [Bacilli bacterium]|nr:hypothetical protein [Bacilli bacterium]
MKSFYGQMNQVRELDRLGNWSYHRQDIKRLIEQSLGKHLPGDEAIIFGAGNCDDLDLPYLANRFKSVTLADIDGEAVHKALESLDFSLQSHFKVLDSLDFTQLDQIAFYESFQSLLENQMPAERIIDFLQQAAQEVGKQPFLAQLHKKFAAVLSSAVHTQLFYLHALSQFAVYAKWYGKEDIQQIVNEIANIRDILLRNYNDHLLSLAKSNGSIIIWTDMILLDSQTNFIMKTMVSLATETERAYYMLRMMASYGIESAVLAVQDLNEKLAPEGKLLRSWIWPFNAEKQFVTVGISGRVKE